MAIISYEQDIGAPVVKLILLCLFLTTSTLAAETRQAQPGVPAPSASISDLAWLAGEWNGEGLGGAVHEIYSSPFDGQIVGHFRHSKDGKIQFYEITTVAEVNGSLEIRVKHFNADLTGWEDKAEIQKFPLVAVANDVWYFDGLTIRRNGANGMLVTVLITMKNGTSSELAFTYRR